MTWNCSLVPFLLTGSYNEPNSFELKLPTTINFKILSVVSKLKVEINYSTIASTIQVLSAKGQKKHFIINVFQKTWAKGLRGWGV